jgi:phosphocarrier protein FPr
MAVELLPPELAQGVFFCSAPLVEGCIAAAVQVSLGSDAAAVCREAASALLPKQEQLGESAPPQSGVLPVVETPSVEVLEISVTLKNLHGLHARPAARFVQLASSFDAEVGVRNERSGKGPVAARSLNGLATLGAKQGDRITIQASGREAKKALEALNRLVEDAFGEAEAPAPKAVPTRAGAAEPGALQAEPISPGIAFGPLVQLRPRRPPVPEGATDDPPAAWERLQEAIRTAARAVREQRKQVAAGLGEANAAIFDAHLLILNDPDLLAQAHALIFDQKLNEAAAWSGAIQAVASQYQELDDPYLRLRALDVTDLGDQVLYVLSGKTTFEKVDLSLPSILLAGELTPAQTAGLDIEKILGLITTGGGPTSHSAILARAMGIPAVSGASPVLESLPAGAQVAIDGSSGKIWVSPSAEKLAELEGQRRAWMAAQVELRQSSQDAAITRDGQRIEVVANAASLPEVELALKNGAEGIGLLRTEFLFLTRQAPPTEEEQFEKLAEIMRRMGRLPVIVRTLDAGGDKELTYLNMPVEANPFLGVRAIRLCLQQPDLFHTQLRAILRAGGEGKLRIMFPMIAGLDEVLQARRFVEEAHLTLVQSGVRHAWPVEVGIMVEIPSAALLSPILAQHVDFFSIGTNDLTQYTLAAERGNPALSHLSDAMHPAVLGLIQKVVEAAHARGKWVGVCGELAGDPAAAPVLVGLGVDELSLAPAGIPRIKAVVRGLNYGEAQILAHQVLAASDAPQARKIVQGKA